MKNPKQVGLAMLNAVLVLRHISTEYSTATHGVDPQLKSLTPEQKQKLGQISNEVCDLEERITSFLEDVNQS